VFYSFPFKPIFVVVVLAMLPTTTHAHIHSGTVKEITTTSNTLFSVSLSISTGLALYYQVSVMLIYKIVNKN